MLHDLWLLRNLQLSLLQLQYDISLCPTVCGARVLLAATVGGDAAPLTNQCSFDDGLSTLYL